MKNFKTIKKIVKNPFIVIPMVMVLAIASFLIYESGFSLEVDLNGTVVGYAKNKEIINEASELVEENVLATYGDEAYFKQELNSEKVRKHKDDVLEAEALSESIKRHIDIYKPASVILVDKQETVAVESKELADEILDEIKKPFKKLEEDRKMVEVYFEQDVSVVNQDVLVENILPKELAILPFIGESSNSKVDKEVNAYAPSPVSYLLDTDQLSNLDSNEDIHGDVESKFNLKAKNVKLNVISVMEEVEVEDIEYESKEEKDDSLYVGETKVVQKGSDGEKEITYQLTFVNDKEVKNEKVREEVTKKPKAKIVAKGTKERPQPVVQTNSAPTYNGASSNNIVSIAYEQVNNRVPYLFGGASPSGFDCSGLTHYVFARAGISIPRTAAAQASWGSPVSWSNLQPGDLMLFQGQTGSGVGHAGIYIGNGQMIHASVPGQPVNVTSINYAYFTSRFVTARR